MVVATTTFSTVLADFFDRSLGIGYTGGSPILFGLLLTTLALWHWSLGSVSIKQLTPQKAEIFYWPRSCSRKRWAPRSATGSRPRKPAPANRGSSLDLSRYTASAVIAAFIIGCIMLLLQRAEKVRNRP